jgi:Arm DNA-binding domain
MQRLSNASVTALEAIGRDRLIFDTMSGFAIRVTAKGSKLFFVQAMVGGQKRRITIGEFPKMGVAEAREAARTMLDDIKAGSGARRSMPGTSPSPPWPIAGWPRWCIRSASREP